METTAVEIQVLAWSGLLMVAQFVLMGIYASQQLGTRYLVSPRDENREVTGTAGRLRRAFNNHVEGLVLFTAAAVAVTLSDASSPVTEACAFAYLAARVVYVPTYWFGIPWLRTIVWAVGLLATVTMLLTVLF